MTDKAQQTIEKQQYILEIEKKKIQKPKHKKR